MLGGGGGGGGGGEGGGGGGGGKGRRLLLRLLLRLSGLRRRGLRLLELGDGQYSTARACLVEGIQGEVERTEDIIERIDFWLGCWVSDLVRLWRVFSSSFCFCVCFCS